LYDGRQFREFEGSTAPVESVRLDITRIKRTSGTSGMEVGMTRFEHELAELTYRIADPGSAPDATARDEWLTKLRDAPPRNLVAVISLLSSSGSRQANVKALREAIISEIERKNTDVLVQTMEKLDASAAILGRSSLVLAGIGIILAALQVWQGMGFPRP
jgi:hypothetical protein